MGVREKILELIQQKPFQPFRLILSNGHSHDIRHPELALVSPYYILVGSPDPNWSGPGAISESAMVAMIYIAEVLPLPPVGAGVK